MLLVDDSPFVLEGLRTILSGKRHICVVGTVRSIAAVLAAVQTYRPTVIVSEVQVGRASGIDLCRAIREAYPQIRVLFFTKNNDQRFLLSAIQAGAQGYLLKNVSGEAVIKGVEIVSKGYAIMDPQLTEQIISWVQNRASDSPLQRISECSQADRLILSLLAVGKKNAEVAQRLTITPGALTARLRKLYTRLNISRRSEAVRYFVEWEKCNMGPLRTS